MVKIFLKFIYFILILLIWIKHVNVIKIFKKIILEMAQVLLLDNF